MSETDIAKDSKVKLAGGWLCTGTIHVTRVFVLSLGVVSVALGYYSHFTSAWTSYKDEKPHKICEPIYALNLPKNETILCPDITFERIYLGMVTTWLAISILIAFLFILYPVKDAKETNMELLDFVWNSVAMGLLLFGGVVYVISAVNVDYFYREKTRNFPPQYNLPPGPPKYSDLPEDYHLRKLEKLISGSFALVNCMMCAVTMVQYGNKYPSWGS